MRHESLRAIITPDSWSYKQLTALLRRKCSNSLTSASSKAEKRELDVCVMNLMRRAGTHFDKEKGLILVRKENKSVK